MEMVSNVHRNVIVFATQQFKCSFYCKMYVMQRMPSYTAHAHDVMHAINRSGTFTRRELFMEVEDHKGFVLLNSIFVLEQSVLSIVL